MLKHTHCFHCGLPVTDKKPFTTKVHNKTQVFCCHGCQAVCDAIVASGNEDYYSHKDAPANRVDMAQLPNLLEKLKIYDKPDIQKDFVRSDDKQNWKEAWLILEEIRCAACMWLNERTIRKLDGVLDVQMDYTGQQANVRWDPDKIKLSGILSAITRIGYIAHPFDPSHREALNVEQKQRSIQRIIIAVILGMVVMQSAISSYFFGNPDQNGEFPLWIIISRWSSLFATAVILAYSGQLFFKNAWRDIKNRTLGMDVPIALGLSIAWLGSLYSTILQQGEVYYESIAMFVLFLLIARYIEIRARMNATSLLDRTAKIVPQTALRLSGGNIEEVPVIELQEGEIIRLSPGETAPVDGILLSESSQFNESLLTGESLAVHHQQGELIVSGSINIDQIIELKVKSNSANSTLSKIQKLTQKSLSDRPYYVEIADRIAGKFVGAILSIAFVTFAYWYWVDSSQAIAHTVAVLIVTCPCALALAAPVSLSLCAAGLARLHLLVLRMSSIEEISQVDSVVFDKTGTLTTGIPELKEVYAVGDEVKEEYLAIAAALEQGSSHPFATAIITASKGLEVKTVQRLSHQAGRGVSAYIEQQQWYLGSEAFVATSEINDMYIEKIQSWRKQGFSVLFLKNNAGLQALFCIEDPLREGVSLFLESIKSKQKIILSGDHIESVNAIAKQVGIDTVYGNMTPKNKLQWIKKHQQQGHQVLMLGDGINDAPTLAASNVSISFSNATDLAQSHSDLIILEKGYSHLGKAIKLMSRTRRIIIENLSWAIIYNVIAIPAAAVGWVTPWMAAIGMSLSSLIVVLNSLRLKNGTS